MCEALVFWMIGTIENAFILLLILWAVHYDSTVVAPLLRIRKDR